jgi:hypothetical protein
LRAASSGSRVVGSIRAGAIAGVCPLRGLSSAPVACGLAPGSMERPCPFRYPREPLTMSGAEGPFHAASIPFRLSYEPEAAHALAGEAWKALPQSLATGCAAAELLWASRGARMLKRPSRVPCGRNIPWPFSLSRARRLSLPWRREKAVSGAPQKRARRLRRVIPNILNRSIPRISARVQGGVPRETRPCADIRHRESCLQCLIPRVVWQRA